MAHLPSAQLTEIEDAALAARLRDKVNAFNAKTAAAVGLASLLFVALPELF